MNRNTFRLVILLATVSILGIVITQVYWFRRAFDLEDQRFNREVLTALHNVAGRFFEMNAAAIPSTNPIKRLSANYYVVMINNEIDANLLEFLLRSEFEKREIKADFEYGIYDCTSDEMVYGSYVSFSNTPAQQATDLPKWEDQPYYFGVNFPAQARTGTLLNRLGIWAFSSVVLVVVVVFFGWTLFVIFRQKRLSEIQKDFINNMTHEFKTPISTIALSANVLKDPAILQQPERLKNYASIIEKENKRLKDQVERVLQIASADTLIEFQKEKVDLRQLIEETLLGMKPALEARNAKVEYPKSGQFIVEADPLHLGNIIFNLLDNALKYCDETPQIDISLEPFNGKILLKIKDNGIGIDTAHQKKIFHRFYRVPTGNIHNVKGFGLGLSYVKDSLTQMGGSIAVESVQGVGSTFILYLKAA